MHLLPEFGQIALILALLISLLLSTLPLIGAQRGLAPWMAIARPAAWAQLALVGVAFAILTWAFVTQDFSVRYVATNSNSRVPMMYRYSAVWGAHEGSLLLWTPDPAAWTAAVAGSRNRCRSRWSRGCLGDGHRQPRLPAFLIFTSNPFERFLPAAAEGRDLTLLQDFGLIVHPPMLYMGYVGFRVPFAFAIAALARTATPRGPKKSRAGCAGRGPGPMSPGASSPSASPWAVVGVLRLGWAAGGSGIRRERQLHALAGRRGAAAFAGDHREARQLRSWTLPGDRGVLAVAARHLPGASGVLTQRACVRVRSRRGLFILIFLGSGLRPHRCC